MTCKHGSGIVKETLWVENGEVILVSEDESHIYFRDKIYVEEK